MGDLIRMTRRHAAAPSPVEDPEPLWRELSGRVLRRHRREHEQTLAEVAECAGISTQYLSEIERGRKEPSSEILAAVCGALGLTMLDLTGEVVGDLRGGRRWASGAGPSGPLALAG